MRAALTTLEVLEREEVGQRSIDAGQLLARAARRSSG
jgi:hypothetical protein